MSAASEGSPTLGPSSAAVGNDLETLAAALDAAHIAKPHPAPWGDPRAMTRALGEVRSRFGDMAVISESPRSARALLAFRAGGGALRFMDLKYACYALVRPNAWDGRRLLDDARLLAELLRQVDGWSSQPRRFRQCYRGLLASYFACPEYLLTSEPGGKGATPGRQGWEQLRDYLRRARPSVAASSPPLDWTEALAAHPGILADRPWETIATAAPQGTPALDATWDKLCRQLNAPTSWSEAMALWGLLEGLEHTDNARFQQQAAELLAALDGPREPPLTPAFIKRCRERLAELRRAAGIAPN